jgi:tripeptide aminopeptidase
LRWKLSVTGPGGHSWGAFGNASAIHGIARVIARIADVEVPTDPKTTFNVGMINGGVSINTIAPDASALIDMRSIDPDALQRLASEIQGIISDEVGDGLRAHISVLGERPAGSCPLDAPIVQLAGSVLQAMGITPVFDASSTDANIPISRGIPAICIGITHGGFAHTTEEFIEIPPIAKGIEQLAHLSIGAMQIVSTSRS